MTAFRAYFQLRIRRAFVDMITSNAVKRAATTFTLKTRMIPPVIVKPQPEKYHPYEDAINHGDCRQVGHS